MGGAPIWEDTRCGFPHVGANVGARSPSQQCQERCSSPRPSRRRRRTNRRISRPIKTPEITEAPHLSPEALPTAVPEAATAIENSFIVIMAADPVVAYEGGEPGLADGGGPRRELDVDAPAVEEYVEDLEDEQDEVLAAVGIDPAVQGRPTPTRSMASRPRCRRTRPTPCAVSPAWPTSCPTPLRQLATDNTPKFLGLSGSNGPWAAGYTGEDVVVGVIDTGIWPEHPSLPTTGRTAAARFSGPALRVRHHRQQPRRRAVRVQQQALGVRLLRHLPGHAAARVRLPA